MFKNTASMTLTQYIEIKKAEYCYIELIPIKSNKNNNTGDIAKVINQLFKNISERIRREEKKLIIQTNQKVSYYIHITKESTQFFFIIPKVHINIFRSKISEIWKHVKIKEVEHIPFNNESSKYYLKYTHDESLSLEVDKRNNDLLNANLSVLEVLDECDEVGILYNFIPTSDRESRGFRYQYMKSIEQYKNGYDLKKTKNIKDITVIILKSLISFIDELLGVKKSVFISNVKELSNSSKKKANSEICNTQILISAKSNDINSETKLIRATTNTFNAISNDNSLRAKKVKNKIDIEQPLLPLPKVATSTDEVSNFIALPGKELIEQYKNINHLDIIENPIPKCLQCGNMFIGLVNYKEQVYKAFFSTHKEFQNLERVLIGSKGSGKSYKMMKMAQNAIELGNGVVVIDIIGDCKLSKSISEKTPKDKLVRIRCNNFEDIQAYVYNEIPLNESMKPYEIVSNAIQRTQQLQVLLDAINDDSSKLSSRMIKFLFSAGAVTYSSNHNASLSDVLECLEYHDVRHSLINNLSDGVKKLLEKRIKKLLELDEVDKNGNVKGTKESKIEGILDRVALLEMSSHTEAALNKKANENINFVDAIRDNKVILIEIPEQEFPSQMLRNIMATFYLSKIWLAKILLDKETHQPITELLFDEFYKCPNAQLLFEMIFAEARKYRLISTVAIHSLSQLSSKCRMTLKSGGASYLLLSGADIQAYRELHVQFEKFGYDEESFLDLETYSALCLIKNEDENYSAFIARLPS
ncbi:hypothetical protein QOZ83_16930 [Romboutsia sedimentorum]|uniref:hypothetical protein n=1 Tax=Romboutsia sedimentorum TaxID=1368474 RepID=UPI0024DE0929|nr:hypothetical protein [Romboutsia sedimentorum]MDK2587525.1 hypothetical protein [Romboutsia sedimentorum]